MRAVLVIVVVYDAINEVHSILITTHFGIFQVGANTWFTCHRLLPRLSILRVFSLKNQLICIKAVDWLSGIIVREIVCIRFLLSGGFGWINRFRWRAHQLLILLLFQKWINSFFGLHWCLIWNKITVTYHTFFGQSLTQFILIVQIEILKSHYAC